MSFNKYDIIICKSYFMLKNDKFDSLNWILLFYVWVKKFNTLKPTICHNNCLLLVYHTNISLSVSFYLQDVHYYFFLKILRYSGLSPFSVFPRCQCVYTHQAERTPALQQNWQSSEKSQSFKEKNTIFNEHPVYMQQYSIRAVHKIISRQTSTFLELILNLLRTPD